MAFDVKSMISTLKNQRQHLMKHLKGLRDDQWDWKPYPECKSIKETLAHLIQDDRAFLEALESGKMPDFDKLAEHETDVHKLLEKLGDSHKNLCSVLEKRFADTPLDTKIFFFGGPMSLGNAVAGISAEDGYHAGQVAYIRLATDPEWNYYKEVYGEE